MKKSRQPKGMFSIRIYIHTQFANTSSVVDAEMIGFAFPIFLIDLSALRYII